MIPVILDTDTNNELDDQHALSYLILQPGTFKTVGVTVNATILGDGIKGHMAEAHRVINLCGLTGAFPVIPGADAEDTFDNCKGKSDTNLAAQFIIEQSRNAASQGSKLVIIAIGKLTNIALALHQAPDIITPSLTVVWLGSNWPSEAHYKGEYNFRNDCSAVVETLAKVESHNLDLKIVPVYPAPGGSISGTTRVKLSVKNVQEQLAGLGPRVAEEIEGRNESGKFTCFGDYSVSLFENRAHKKFDTCALHDVVAVAIVKNSKWAVEAHEPTPRLVETKKGEGNGSPMDWDNNTAGSSKNTVCICHSFAKDEILADLVSVLQASTKPVVH